MQRNKDDVYFFTIIDFLIQVIFFGVFVFVAYQSTLKSTEGRAKEEERKMLTASGVSSLTEITDFFSRMGPIAELKGIADYFSPVDRARSVQEVKDALRQAGSTTKLKEMVAAQARKEGQGMPPCLSLVQNGRPVVQSVATVISTDTTIEFTENTPALQRLLGESDLEYASVRLLSFEAFRRAFSRVSRNRPDCRYTLDVLERTRFVDARDAISSAFYLRIRRK